MLSGKFFPEIIHHLIVWSSKIFIIILVSLEFCMDAQKYSKDFAPLKELIFWDLPHIEMLNTTVFFT